MRLIDADALKKAIIKRLGIKSEQYLLASERSIYNLIDEQPTIELLKEQEPIKPVHRGWDQEEFFCGKCGMHFEVWNPHTFCARCGQRIDMSDYEK